MKHRSTVSAKLFAIVLAFAALFVLTGFVRPASVYAEAAPTAEATAEPSDEKSEQGEANPQGDTTTTGAVEEAEEAEEEPKIEFVLFEKLGKLDAKEWIFFGAALALAAVLVIYLATRKNDSGKQTDIERKVSPTIMLVHGALCIALSFVLSYIKLFSMPAGGSITLASMLPLIIYANRYGVRSGMLAGLVYGILQYIQGGYFVHWLQFCFDYLLAFALIGLAGVTRGEKNLVFSVLIGGTARFLSHFIGGVLFFGKFVMIGEGAETGMSLMQMLPANIGASFTYNAPYMFADIAICAVIALLPPFRKAIRSALKY